MTEIYLIENCNPYHCETIQLLWARVNFCRKSWLHWKRCVARVCSSNALEPHWLCSSLIIIFLKRLGFPPTHRLLTCPSYLCRLHQQSISSWIQWQIFLVMFQSIHSALRVIPLPLPSLVKSPSSQYSLHLGVTLVLLSPWASVRPVVN